MSRHTLLIQLLCCFSALSLSAQNPWIQPITQMVSGDSLFKTIADLQPMNRVTAANSQIPPDYLKQRLLSYQVDTVFFQYFKPNTPPNVVGIRYGVTEPDAFWVMGAHYDAVLPGAGADDNGSGTAAVIEMARVTHGFQLEKSLMLVLFAAEEVGLWGSYAFVDSARNHFSIEGMINLDMIAYSHNNLDSSVSVCWKYFCQNLIQDYLSACSLYVPELFIEQDTTSNLIYASDHAPFWYQMIPALFLIENADRWGGSFNPYYHQYTDTLGLSANSKWLAKMITRSAVATLMFITQPTPTIGISKQQPPKENITIYPNPASSSITISTKSDLQSNLNVTIIDQYGRVMNRYPNHKNTESLEVSWLPTGIYFVKVQHNSHSMVHQLIKI